MTTNTPIAIDPETLKAWLAQIPSDFNFGPEDLDIGPELFNALQEMTNSDPIGTVPRPNVVKRTARRTFQTAAEAGHTVASGTKRVARFTYRGGRKAVTTTVDTVMVPLRYAEEKTLVAGAWTYDKIQLALAKHPHIANFVAAFAVTFAVTFVFAFIYILAVIAVFAVLGMFL